MFWNLTGSINNRTESPDNDSAFCDNISSNSGNGSNGFTDNSATNTPSNQPGGDQYVQFHGHLNGKLQMRNVI